MVVVVAGHDHDLAAGPERLPELAQWPLGGSHRIAHGTVTEFEHVAQQDKPAVLGQLRQQRRA
jgi:hypothetical protein